MQQRHRQLLRGRPVLARHRPRRQHQPGHRQHGQRRAQPRSARLGLREEQPGQRQLGHVAQVVGHHPAVRLVQARRGARRRPTARTCGSPPVARTASEITSEVCGSASHRRRQQHLDDVHREQLAVLGREHLGLVRTRPRSGSRCAAGVATTSNGFSVPLAAAVRSRCSAVLAQLRAARSAGPAGRTGRAPPTGCRAAPPRR